VASVAVGNIESPCETDHELQANERAAGKRQFSGQITLVFWPSLDAGLAINQAVAALYTLAGTFVGGYFAFRLGLRQLLHGRAIDRRLEWSERLGDAANEYIGTVGLVVTLCEEEDPSFIVDYADLIRRTLAEAHAQGRLLDTLLGRAELYGTREERIATHSMMGQVAVASVVTAGHFAKTMPTTEDVTTLKAALAALRDYRPAIVARVREEIGLDR
jgi:hypothetical protein